LSSSIFLENYLLCVEQYLPVVYNSRWSQYLIIKLFQME
jgi:hypothetical protein